METNRTLKIINIVENLDKGAVENWLVRIFLKSREERPDWDWTFYCILGKPGRLDDKVLLAGGRIIYSPVSVGDKRTFISNLRKVLKEGQFDIIHSHHDYLSGFYLLASAGIKFRKRILQIHNTDKALPVGNRFLHNLLLKPFRRLAFHFSDLIVGISEDTLLEFTGKFRTSKPLTTVLYYGIDLEPFEKAVVDNDFNTQFNFPAHARSLLFVGRMNPWKNPLFVLEILRELNSKRSDVYAIFVGQGDLENELTDLAAKWNLGDRIRVLGWSDNTAWLMKNASVFVFPRLEYPREGLGLVVVEAQAAGLPMAISYAIVKDAIVIPGLAHYVKLDNNPKEWSTQIDRLLDSPSPISKTVALEQMRQSPFELRKAMLNFLSLYEI